MPSRSQRHMREQYGTYDGDSAGQTAPRLLTAFVDPDTGTTVSEATAANFAGYPRTYSASGLPTGTTINTATGVVSGTATPGTYSTVIITVANSFGTAVSNTFEWTVT